VGEEAAEPLTRTGVSVVSARRMLTSAAVAQTAISFVQFSLFTIGPELRAHYQVSLAGLGLVLSATLFGIGLAYLPTGIAIDRYGPYPVMCAGTPLAVTGLTVAAFAPTSSTLFAALFVAGLGSSVVPIVGMRALVLAYAAERRAWALGMRQMAVPLGGMIAAVIAPGLVALGGVRLALLAAAGAVSLAGGALAAAVRGEPPLPRPAASARSWRLRSVGNMGRLLLVAACYTVVLQAVLAYSVPAARAAGIDRVGAAAMFFAVNAAAAVSRVVWGRIADRGGGSLRERTLVVIGWITAAGAVAFALSLHGATAAVIIAGGAFAFGALGWNGVLYASAAEHGAREVAGQSLAIAAALVAMLAAAATPPLGALAEHAGWDAFWLITGILAAVGATIAASSARLQARRAEPR
jgi:MFS family permease